jgi:hypothetical protein
MRFLSRSLSFYRSYFPNIEDKATQPGMLQRLLSALAKADQSGEVSKDALSCRERKAVKLQ